MTPGGWLLAMTPQRVIASPAWSAGRGDLLGRKYLPARRLPRRRCAAPRNDTWGVAPRNDTWGVAPRNDTWGWLLAMTLDCGTNRSGRRRRSVVGWRSYPAEREGRCGTGPLAGLVPRPARSYTRPGGPPVTVGATWGVGPA